MKLAPGSTGLPSSGPKRITVRLTERVVVATEISQVEGYCWPLMFPGDQTIRRQEDENRCGHSWSTETHLGISTYSGSHYFHWAIEPPKEELPSALQMRTIRSRHRKMSQVTAKVNIRWKENNFELRRLFTSNVSFLFEPVVLYISQKDHSKRPFLETISRRIASPYLLISKETEMTAVTKLTLCSDLPVFSYNFYQNLTLST